MKQYMPPISRRLLNSAGLALAACLAAAPVWAQSSAWPNKPVRIVVPFPPGGTTDILARAIAPELGKAFGQSFIVENRGGAGGNVGTEIVAKSSNDGYTLLMGTVGTHGINRALYDKLPYDPIKDFVPITLVASVPNVMVMNTDKARTRGINSVQDFIQYA
jgi:tripartite-type tricarboxylate transporter receptor subunit TctC